MTTTQDIAAEIARLTRIRDRAQARAFMVGNRYSETGAENLAKEAAGKRWSAQADLAQKAIDKLR